MIFLKTMTGRTLVVNQDVFNGLITPRQILERISYLSNLDIAQFRLVFAGRAVEGELLDQNLTELGWVHGSVVHIVARSPEAREFLAAAPHNIEVAPPAAGFRP